MKNFEIVKRKEGTREIVTLVPKKEEKPKPKKLKNKV